MDCEGLKRMLIDQKNISYFVHKHLIFLVGNIIWRDHNFEYDPYCRKNIFQGISRDDAFRNFVPFETEYEGHI